LTGSALLRAALWYNARWRVSVVFMDIYKRPLPREWGHLYMARMTQADVASLYRSVAGQRPAAVAVLPSPDSRVLTIDVDRPPAAAEELARRLASTGAAYAAITPRGGLRAALLLRDRSELPEKVSVHRGGERVGEGGGTAKHLWTYPPGVACVEERAGRCARLGQYLFVLPSGRKTPYPWEVPEPPALGLSEALDIASTALGLEVSAGGGEAGGRAPPRPAQAPSKPLLPVPVFRDLEEFREYAFGAWPGPRVPLPRCVARALGAGEFWGQPVPRGERYVYGAAAVLFLSAVVAEFDPAELVALVGSNLEGFPGDSGQPLDAKLTQLIAEYRGLYIPRYGGLAHVKRSIPEEFCRQCPYYRPCSARTDVWMHFAREYYYELSKELKNRGRG